jgi:hypothetical protein
LGELLVIILLTKAGFDYEMLFKAVKPRAAPCEAGWLEGRKQAPDN